MRTYVKDKFYANIVSKIVKLIDKITEKLNELPRINIAYK